MCHTLGSVPRKVPWGWNISSAKADTENFLIHFCILKAQDQWPTWHWHVVSFLS